MKCGNNCAAHTQEMEIHFKTRKFWKILSIWWTERSIFCEVKFCEVCRFELGFIWSALDFLSIWMDSGHELEIIPWVWLLVKDFTVLDISYWEQKWISLKAKDLKRSCSVNFIRLITYCLIYRMSLLIAEGFLWTHIHCLFNKQCCLFYDGINLSLFRHWSTCGTQILQTW